MTRFWASLRLRLALGGFVAMYFPVLVLWAVVFTTSEENATAGDLVSVSGPSTSGWVIATVVGLAPLAAVASWVWSGRAVAPLRSIQQQIDDIDSSDLRRRLEIESGPTEFRQLASSFDGMLDRLERAGELQNRLIEDASHELRTPLAVLIGTADVLLDDPNPTLQGYEDGLRSTGAAARRLAGIVDGLLVDARARARVLDRRPADLVGMCRDVMTSLADLAAERDVTVVLTTDQPTSAAVDRASVLRAVTNLVENAIRYTYPATTVEVSVERHATQVVVAVSDRGPGIPAEQQRVVFERFGRVVDDAGGSGLGLAIARQVADAHGGVLELRSPGPTGDGCVFELRLPRTTQA